MQPNLPEIAIEPSVRHGLFLAVKETLNNAFKHSGAKELHLYIGYASGVFEILVRDNGKGFDPSMPSQRSGLKGMHERLSQIGGTCHISSSSEGSSVEIHLPIAG